MSFNNDMKISILQMVIGVLSSCVPGCDSRVVATFENCTNDTIFVGVSHYDNIDSVNCQLFASYSLPTNALLDTTSISLWTDIYTLKDQCVYPDSRCWVNANYLFDEHDTCYFFLVKWRDAKRYSWNEIRTKKIYYKWKIIKEQNGKFKRNISK